MVSVERMKDIQDLTVLVGAARPEVGLALSELTEEVRSLRAELRYFTDRCEGVHPTDGPIRSRRTYARFKKALGDFVPVEV